MREYLIKLYVRDPKGIRDGKVKASIEGIIRLVHKRSGILLTWHRSVREKIGSGITCLNLSALGEGEMRESETDIEGQRVPETRSRCSRV